MTPSTPPKARECITHHYACDCREAAFEQMRKELECYKQALEYAQRALINDKCLHNATLAEIERILSVDFDTSETK